VFTFVVGALLPFAENKSAKWGTQARPARWLVTVQ
jgi:hypothetical protein